MKDEEEYRDYDERGGCAIGTAFVCVALVILCVAFWAICLTGCTPTRYIPVETVRTEYKEADTTAIYNRIRSIFESTRQKDTSRDSLIDRIRETVTLNEKGDTTRHDLERIVYRSTKHEIELERKVLRQDSIIESLWTELESVKSDSIPVPYPVERRLTWWQQTKLDLGGYAIVVIIAAISIAVVWIARKFGRR